MPALAARIVYPRYSDGYLCAWGLCAIGLSLLPNPLLWWAISWWLFDEICIHVFGMSPYAIETLTLLPDGSYRIESRSGGVMRVHLLPQTRWMGRVVFLFFREVENGHLHAYVLFKNQLRCEQWSRLVWQWRWGRL